MEKIRQKKIHLDTITLTLFILLVGVGFATLLSASYLEAELYRSSPYFFVENQLKKLIIGIALMIIIYFLPTKYWQKGALALTVCSLCLLIAAFIPFFQMNLMDTDRWIKILGIQLQPSEVAKIAVVVYMAYSLSRKGELAQGFWYGFLPHASVLALFGFLIVLEKDLGGAIVIAGIVMSLSFVSGLRKFYFVLFAVILGLATWYFVTNYGYRMDRISGWLDPEADPQGAGYVILHSFNAFANGGIFGMGAGEGIEKQFFIPEIHTDYIFSVIGEEFGLLGVITVCGLFLGLTIRGFLIARAATNLFNFFLAVGATVVVSIPAFINMGVALSLWPAKGLALPFFSYGGSNLVISSIAVAILLQVASESSKETLAEEGAVKKINITPSKLQVSSSSLSASPSTDSTATIVPTLKTT